MASTKALTVLANDITLVPATPQTFSWTLYAVGGASGYGAEVSIKITNDATGPTVAAQVQVTHSYDGTNYYNTGGAVVGSVTNAAVVSVPVQIPLGAKYVQCVAGSNTVQNVTIRIEGMEMTAI